MCERAELYGGILSAGPRNPTDAMLRAGVAKAWFDGRPGPYVPGMDAAGGPSPRRPHQLRRRPDIPVSRRIDADHDDRRGRP
jgi:hypothetical protein